MHRLENAQPFPSLVLPAVGGGKISLPDDVAGKWATILVYRGAWCPYCAAQLAAFGRAGAQLAKEDVAVIALSVDDEATSAATVEKHGIEFPVGHSADAAAVSELLGTYLGDHGNGPFLQSTGFVLKPDGTVAVAVYSSEAIGRLTAPDVLGYVAYQKSQG